jgi:hypothetical protein
MLRDTRVGLIEPMLTAWESIHAADNAPSDDRPRGLENTRPEGAESTSAENARSPFPAEPGRPWLRFANSLRK